MIKPSYDDFKKLTRKGNLIAVRLDISSDLETPVSSFLKLCVSEPCTFLLESAEQEERIGRYSFLGFDPELILFSEKGTIYTKSKNKTRVSDEPNLLSAMKTILSRYRLANPEGLPSFAGGFVGFLGYENVGRFEKVRIREKTGLSLEDGVFFLVREFLMFDHFKKTLSIVSLCHTNTKTSVSTKQLYRQATERMMKLEKRLQNKRPARRQTKSGTNTFFKSNLNKKQFVTRVMQIKKYIRAGDCIQVVFSQRFNLGKVQHDFEIYRALRSINPSPYMFYFRFGKTRLIGSSPELLVKKVGRIAEVHPIAGTRPRGQNFSQDSKLEESLRRSVKEKAEHLMLVDLGRNDLGRVCDFKSIRVSEFAKVERYSHVMHLVSTINGRLKPGKDAFDLFKGTFPAGTVTGAPKIRAMEIIDELEPEKRGPYAGALGYFSFNQDMDMCIIIRTVVVSGDRAYIQAGAGIVYDSNPKREYEETINKARALIRAVHGKERPLP